MARSSDLPPPPQADEAPTAKTPPQTAAEAEAEAEASSSPPRLAALTLWMPPIGMIVRIITLVCLVLSVSLLASNSAAVRIRDFDPFDSSDSSNSTITSNDFTATLHFNDIYAYRYALSTAVIGLCYTSLVLLSSIQQVRSGKLPDPKILVYKFLGDKVILALLATGVGAAFGATVDLKASMDKFENEIETVTTSLAPIVAKFDDFFNRAYIPAIFLLFAFLTSGVSSILSSLAFINKSK